MESLNQEKIANFSISRKEIQRCLSIAQYCIVNLFFHLLSSQYKTYGDKNLNYRNNMFLGFTMTQNIIINTMLGRAQDPRSNGAK